MPAPDRARALRRMATGLLVAMAGLFMLSRHMAAAHPGWNWPLAFSEAAMVGGLADWFAVSALFRRPFGLPIPHTAIIPANKDRIADSMAGFLLSHFLTPQVVARRLRSVNMAGAVAQFLADPRRREDARGGRSGPLGLLADVVESLPAGQLGHFFTSATKSQLARLDVATPIGQMLAKAIEDGRHVPLMEAVLRWAGITLEANEDLLRAMIHERANTLLRWTGLDEKLANSILDGLYRLLAQCIVDPDHPLRRKIEEGLVELAENLARDDRLRAKVARMQREVLANPVTEAWLDALWRKGRSALLTAMREGEMARPARLAEALASLGTSLSEDAKLQRLLNRHARRLLTSLVARYGEGIVTLVSVTVKRWDARTVTARIEGAVGRDLQFIRINGTLVGGSVGVILHGLNLVF